MKKQNLESNEINPIRGRGIRQDELTCELKKTGGHTNHPTNALDLNEIMVDRLLSVWILS